MYYGAIDIGSNAVRLLIAKVCPTTDGQSLDRIHYERLPIRLGEDVFENGVISAEKKNRLADALGSFKKEMDTHEIIAYRAVATSAMRDASNQKEILDHLYNETGILVEIIDGSTEAALVARAIQSTLPCDTKSFAVIDVGGGSTEIGFHANNGSSFQSFEIGSIRHFKGKTAAQTWQDIQQWIMNNQKESHSYEVFATGGNIKKVRDVLNKNGRDISVEAMESFHATIAPMTIEERIERFEFRHNTAEVIVAAMDIYLFVLKAMNAKTVGVPEVRLSDGVVLRLNEPDKRH